MTFDFDKALEAGYNEQEIYNFLKDNNEKQNLGYDFANLEKKHKDFNAVWESIKSGDKGQLSEAEKREIERQKRADLLAKREAENKAFEAEKNAFSKELENGRFFKNMAEGFVDNFVPIELDKYAFKGLNKLGLDLKTKEQRDKFDKAFLNEAKEKLKKGDENLNLAQKVALFNRHGSDTKRNIEREKAMLKLEDKEGKFSKEEKELIEDDLGFFNTLFNDDKENIKEFKEKRKSEAIINDEIIKAMNTLKQFDEGNLFRNALFADKKEALAFKQNMLKDAYKIAELQGFDDVGMDKEGELYFIKNENGKEQKYLVNTGFFDNFWQSFFEDSKHEIGGAIIGGIAGAKRGKNAFTIGLNSIIGAAVGSAGGGFIDAKIADMKLNKEANYKANLEYALQAGLLSAAGDTALIGAYHLAKPAFKGAVSGVKGTYNYAKNHSVLGLFSTIPSQNINAANKIIDEVFTPEMKEELKAAQKEYGGGVRGEDLANPVFEKLKESFAKKYGKEDIKTQKIAKLAEIFNQNSLKTKQQEMLDLIRSDKDGSTLAYLLEVAKDDVKIQNNLKNMLNLASLNVEKNLKNLNINPREIKQILDEFEAGNKAAFKEVESQISKLYNEDIRVVLDRTHYENIKKDFLENGVNLDEMTPFLRDLENNVFAKEGVTFAKLNNFRKNLNFYIFNKDKTPNFINTLKKISETSLKAEIDKGIDNIFNELPNAYASIKELYSTSLKDYAAMKELNENIKNLKLQDSAKSADEVVDSLIKYAKGQGENGVNNLQKIKTYLGEENNAFLEMQILNRLFKESVIENDRAKVRVFDSEGFLNRVKELVGDTPAPLGANLEARALSGASQGPSKQENFIKKALNEAEFKERNAFIERFSHLKGLLFSNENTGIKASFGTAGFKKMTSDKAILKSVNNGFSVKEHLEAVKNIKELYEKASYKGLDDDVKHSDKAVKIHRFISEFEGGNAEILVKESLDKNQNKIYTLELKELHKDNADIIPTFIRQGSKGKAAGTTTESITQPLFKSKEAREFLELVEGFHKLYKNDAIIAKNFTQGTASQLSTSIATSAEGAIKQKVVKGGFDPIFRLLPDGILFGLFSKQIQGGALRYHLRKALSRSLNYDDFKLKLERELKRTNFNSNTSRLIEKFMQNLEDFNAEKEAKLARIREEEELQRAQELKRQEANNLKDILEAEESPLREDFGVNFEGFKGKEAVLKLLSERKGQVKGAFYKEGLGDIDLVWGDENFGLEHIIKKHGGEFENLAKELSEAVENGKIVKDDKGRLRLEYENKIVGIKDNWKGEKTAHWVVTAYVKKEKEASLYTSTSFTKGETLPLNSKESIAQKAKNDEVLEAEVIEEVGLNEPMKFLEFQQRKLLTYIKENTPLRLLEYKKELKTRDILNYLEQSALNGKEKAFLMRNLERDLGKIEAKIKEKESVKKNTYEISQKEAEELQRHFNFKGKKPLLRELRENEINHALKSHGDKESEEARGNIAIVREDIEANYPKITQEFDEKFFTQKGVIYVKQVNGHHIVIEEALSGQDKLIFKTMWKTKGNYNKEVLTKNAKTSSYPQNADEAVRTESISKQELEQSNPQQSHLSTKESIAQNTQEIKPLSKKDWTQFKRDKEKFAKKYEEVQGLSRLKDEISHQKHLKEQAERNLKEHYSDEKLQEAKNEIALAKTSEEKDHAKWWADEGFLKERQWHLDNLQEANEELEKLERELKKALEDDELKKQELNELKKELEKKHYEFYNFDNRLILGLKLDALTPLDVIKNAFYYGLERISPKEALGHLDANKKGLIKVPYILKLFDKLVEITKEPQIREIFNKRTEILNKKEQEQFFKELEPALDKLMQKPAKAEESPLTKGSEDIIFTDTKGKEHILSKEVQEQWKEAFNLKSLEDSYIPNHNEAIKQALEGKEIKLQLGSLKKLVAQGREKYIPQIKEVLDSPEAIMRDDMGEYLFIKHLKDDDYFVNVSFDNGEYLVSISNGIKETRNLNNKLKKGGEFIYQSPNFNFISQKLLQTSQYSANKIDDESIAQNANRNFKEREKMLNKVLNLSENEDKIIREGFDESYGEKLLRQGIEENALYVKKLLTQLKELESIDKQSEQYALKLKELDRNIEDYWDNFVGKKLLYSFRETQDYTNDEKIIRLRKWGREKFQSLQNAFREQIKDKFEVLKRENANLSENVESENEALKQAQKAWLEAFGLKSMEEAYTPKFSKEVSEALESVLKGDEIRLTKGSFIKLLKENRFKYLDRIKETLENPQRVILQNDGALIFARNYGEEKYFTSVAKNANNEWVIVSNAPKSENGLNNKIKNGGKELYNQADGQINAFAPYDDIANSNIKLDEEIITQKPQQKALNLQEIEQVLKARKSQINDEIIAIDRAFEDKAFRENLKEASKVKPILEALKKEWEALEPFIITWTHTDYSGPKPKKYYNRKPNLSNLWHIEETLDVYKGYARENDHQANQVEREIALLEKYVKLLKDKEAEVKKLETDKKALLTESYIIPAYNKLREAFKNGQHTTKQMLEAKNIKQDSPLAKFEIDKIAELRQYLEDTFNITPLKEFGINYAEFYRDGKGAAEKLIKEAQAFKESGEKGEFKGQVAGAFYREELGDIDLVWGDENFGLRHILEKHGGEFEDIAKDLSEAMENGVLKKQNEVRSRIEYGNFVIGLSGEFKGEKRAFIITAFKRKGKSSTLSPKQDFTDKSDDVLSNQESIARRRTDLPSSQSEAEKTTSANANEIIPQKTLEKITPLSAKEWRQFEKDREYFEKNYRYNALVESDSYQKELKNEISDIKRKIQDDEKYLKYALDEDNLKRLKKEDQEERKINPKYYGAQRIIEQLMKARETLPREIKELKEKLKKLESKEAFEEAKRADEEAFKEAQKAREEIEEFIKDKPHYEYIIQSDEVRLSLKPEKISVIDILKKFTSTIDIPRLFNGIKNMEKEELSLINEKSNNIDRAKKILYNFLKDRKDIENFLKEYPKQYIEKKSEKAKFLKEFEDFLNGKKIKSYDRNKELKKIINSVYSIDKGLSSDEAILRAKRLADKAFLKTQDEEYIKNLKKWSEGAKYSNAEDGLPYIDKKGFYYNDKELLNGEYAKAYEEYLKEYKNFSEFINDLMWSKTYGDFNITLKITLKEYFSKHRKSVLNEGTFNEKSPNIYHSNPHLGAGVLGGSLNGVEQDEEGNLSFDPAKFVAGFLGASVGSKAVGVGFKHLEKNPALKEKIITELSDTLAQGFEKARDKYPLLSLLEPRYIVQNERGRKIQAKVMLKELEKEQKGLFNVAYNGKNAVLIKKDLEAVEEAILFEKGTKRKGGKHIRLAHSTEPSQEGYVTKQEVANLGVNIREYLKNYEPFIDKNKARLYEWQDNEGVKFRVVVNDLQTSGGNSHLPSASEEIITFYSDRNLKEKMKFKNPVLKVQEKFKFNPQKARDLLEWHKDSHALTKDENGLPKVFYHGTYAKFEVFKRVGKASQQGFFFTPLEKAGEGYGDITLKTFLNIKNPFRADELKINSEADLQKWADILKLDYSKEKYERFKGLKTQLEKVKKATIQAGLKFHSANDRGVYALSRTGKGLYIDLRQLDKETKRRQEAFKPLEELFKSLDEDLGFHYTARNEFDLVLDVLNKKDKYFYTKGRDEVKKVLEKLGYDGVILNDTIITVFNSNQIKHIDNKGSFTDTSGKISKNKPKDKEAEHRYFNEKSPNIYQTNPHLGAGLVGGTLNGVEQDEEGNLSFDPVKFAMGFLGASVGSKAVGVGFKHLEKNPALKEKIITELADTLAQGFDKAREKYPLLSLLEPRYIVQNERGRKIQAKVMLKNLLKLAEKESQKMKLKAYKTLKKYNVDHLEIAKEQEYRDFIANVWDKKNYEKAPNILKIAKLAPKLKKALGLEFDEVFLTKKDLSHFRTARKANYNQALSEAEMLEIPSVITHAKNAYIDTRHKNFFIIFADKKDNTKINFIHFNADELGNYIITTKKADRKVLNDKHYKQVGSGIEPHIP